MTSKNSKTCLFACDFHAVRSTLSHLILAQKNMPDLNVISAGMHPNRTDHIFTELAKSQGYDIDQIPEQKLSDLDLSKIDFVVSYSTPAYQFLLEQKRYYPELKVIFIPLNVPDLESVSDFGQFIKKIDTLLKEHLDFLIQ